MTKTTMTTTKRAWGGRKPLKPEDRKTTVQCYPKQAIVDAIGYEKCQEITLQALEKEYAKIILEKE